MPLMIVINDITKMNVDVVVNAANSSLRRGAGVCGAIFKMAGSLELQKACATIGSCPPGQAVITKGFKLPASYIIHTVGPLWQGGSQGEPETLRDCYFNSLTLAYSMGLDSIAFPLIASGIFGYPEAEALQIAVTTIVDFLANIELTVYLVLFTKEAFSISQKRLDPIQAFIDEYYEARPKSLRLTSLSSRYPVLKENIVTPPKFNDIVRQLGETFTQTLLRLIDVKGKTDVEVYKHANIDRKLFSKIRSNKNYMPSKRTAVALAIGLELDLQETKSFLDKAGYSLSRSQLFDLIIEYFLVNGNHSIYEINEALFYFDQPLLGG